MNGIIKFFPLKRSVKLLSLSLLFPAVSLCCVSCGRSCDYFDYVSELRSNILTAENAEHALRLTVRATEKEYPYAADGYRRKTSSRAEITLSAPTAREYEIAFSYDDNLYGGDMSFDNVKLEYFYSCTLDLSTAEELSVAVTYGETEIEMTAKSVRTQETLTPREILRKAVSAEKEKFNSMTDKNGFAGEIYLRFIYEDAPYYYVGIIDRESKIYALLIDASTGKILARRDM